MALKLRRFTVVTLGLTAAVAFLVGLIVAGSMTPSPATSESLEADVAPGTRSPRLATVVDFADIVERINPAVVNVEAVAPAARRRERPEPGSDRNGERSPGAPGQPERRPREGSGTGVIIEPDGHILTNHHVVDGAARITVRLADGRNWRARLVGADPASDLALLKIEADAPLPSAPLGDSDRVRVGEWVCAIGNPLAYEHTVTVGVVSYVGRKLFDASLDRYIQTDAAITFGNSGGPLIDARGEVVGINSAISSQASGIGFAVPVNQAKVILPQLKATGRVSRGYIGVSLRDLDPELRDGLALGDLQGALVQEVVAGSPGEQAGLQPFDVIVSVDDRDVTSNDQLIAEIARRQPGTLVGLRWLRTDGTHTAAVRLAERPQRRRVAHAADVDPADGPGLSWSGDAIGLTVRRLTHADRETSRVPAEMDGVVISDVGALVAAPPAVRRGAVILEVNRTPVDSPGAYQRLVDAADADAVVTLYLYDPASASRSIETLRVEASVAPDRASQRRQAMTDR